MKPEIATIWACVLVLVLALATSAGSARADEWETLRNDERVHNGLLMIAIGRHIELTCPTIERRTIAAGPSFWAWPTMPCRWAIPGPRSPNMSKTTRTGAHDRHRPAVISPSAA